ncbi:MAG: hypothetical protein R6U17_01640 [Thermoplasmata archaeon]
MRKLAEWKGDVALIFRRRRVGKIRLLKELVNFVPAPTAKTVGMLATLGGNEFVD